MKLDNKSDEELEATIAALKADNMDNEAKPYEAELAKRKGAQMAEDVIKLPVSEEEMEASSSKFAAAGLHVSECTAVTWKQAGVSLQWDFEITDGIDAGKTGTLYTGVTKDAVWKTKEMLKALGVEYAVVDGQVQFKAGECAGKKFQSVWTEQVDTRTPEEGGKGSRYTKPTGAASLDAKIEG